jgi:pimeloyl-ACP methyl ester carboxylesterase
MATYVLVHGAWSGAHGFRRVRPLLTAAGHEVFTPGLTGIGERAHLASPQVTLRTHVQDVVGQVLFEDLRDVVLVGYSYGGMVVTGALAHLADRVRHLLYLDAFVPGDGQSLYDLTGQPVPAPSVDGTWLVPPPAREFEDPAVAAFAVPRRTPHPVGCFTEPVRLDRPLEEFPFTRTYVRATAGAGGPGSGAFDAAAERARTSDAWRYREVATTHMVPENRPGELAALLLELA